MLTRSQATVLLTAVGVALLTETSIRSQSLSPRNANYDIDVTLDPGARTITGIETIDWRNTGTIAAYSLRIHLYWNAFRNTNSTWLKQSRLAGRTPFDDSEESDFGRADISRLEIISADGTATAGEVR